MKSRQRTSLSKTMRAKADVEAIRHDLVEAMLQIRGNIDLTEPENEAAWAQIETFCAIAIRVMEKTNPSKLRDAAMTEEIKARMDGRGVIE